MENEAFNNGIKGLRGELGIVWHDGGFVGGFMRICSTKGYNFLNEEGKLLSSTWWDMAAPFADGFAAVRNDDNKWNHIDKNGNVISSEWWSYVASFREGFAVVWRKCKRNHIDKYGRILSPVWWDDTGQFVDGYAVVFVRENQNPGFKYVDMYTGYYNKIDSHGELLYAEWIYRAFRPLEYDLILYAGGNAELESKKEVGK